MITAGIATVFFILAAYVEVAGFHYSLKTLTAAASAPLFALGAPKSAGGYGGTWIDRLLELVVLFDMLAVAIGCAVSASRGIFAMARDRRIPAAWRSPPSGTTPRSAPRSSWSAPRSLTLAVDVWWKGLFALPATPHYFALFAWGSTFGGFALVVVYLLMAVGSLRSFAHAPGRVSAGGLGGAGHRDHRGRHLRLVLQGHQPHDPRAVVRPGRARDRLRLHLGRPGPAVGQHPARGPVQEHRLSSPRAVIVTGGGTGIGAAVARLLAAGGDRVTAPL